MSRLERNFKMANAASPNVTPPPSKAYLDNYDSIFRKPKPKNPKCKTTSTKQAKTKCGSASAPSSLTTWKPQGSSTAKGAKNISATGISSKKSVSTNKASKQWSLKQLSNLGMSMYGIE